LRGRRIDGITGCSRHGFHVAFADGEVWLLKNGTPVQAVAKLMTFDLASVYDRKDVLSRYKIDSTAAFSEEQ
ncbi:MAG: hypothetical protein KY476_18445, partial [Planctomycetes bacterium]|nr:hypothetical protein [Planctomycetota bacterium]